MAIKHGFVLNFAYCKNCLFSIQNHDGRSFMPLELKENVIAFVTMGHDAPAWKCQKRQLVVSYTHCIYEEEE